MDYKKAGVDIEAGYKSVELMKKYVKETMRPEVMGGIGGFSGAFSLSAIKDMEDPVLLSGTDGVGTKLKLAFLMDKHDTIGIDCVAMCVNDVACAGGEPLFFLDYIACGRNIPEKIATIVKGVAEGCKQSDAALVGGETAEHPGLMPEDEYDLAGFAVGVVERKDLITGENIKPGDVLVGITSSGVHSNGFSLVRKVFDMTKESLDTYYDELGKTLGEALLAPTRIYVKAMKSVKNAGVKVKGCSDTLQTYIVELIKVICKKAGENTTAVMPGYTHLQRAQPITFGHALMAYASMLLRDLQRFEDATARMDAQCPLGSGALAGTTYPLDRQFTAEKLGFAAPCANSLDGVSDRDFCIELANAISICMMHLSRLSEEIILWCSWEFKFIELDDAFTTGSSIMPQKKNPDVTELIRGKTGRVYGDLNTLLVMMKGIPLAYNKDMQEDKEAIFDAVDTLELCLKTVTPMLDTMKTIPANMRRAAAKGFINATDCADYLTKKGMPFRDAYKLTGCMVSDCIAKDKTLEELTLDEFKGYSALFENDIYDAIDLVKCCEGRTSYGGPSEASVNNQIALANAQLDAWEEKNA